MKEIIFSHSMLNGRKCDYSAKYFYSRAGYIFSKATQRIVDIQKSV